VLVNAIVGLLCDLSMVSPTRDRRTAQRDRPPAQIRRQRITNLHIYVYRVTDYWKTVGHSSSCCEGCRNRRQDHSVEAVAIPSSAASVIVACRFQPWLCIPSFPPNKTHSLPLFVWHRCHIPACSRAWHGHWFIFPVCQLFVRSQAQQDRKLKLDIIKLYKITSRR